MKKFAGPSTAPLEAAETTGQRPGEGLADRLLATQRQQDFAAQASQRAKLAEIVARERPLFERCQAAADTMSTNCVEHLAFIRTLERVPWSQFQRSGFTVEMVGKSAKCRLDQCLHGMGYMDAWSHIQGLWKKIQAGALGLRVIGPAGTGWQVLEEWRVAVASFCEQPVSFSTAMTSLQALVGQLDTLLSGITPVAAGTVLPPLLSPPPPPGDQVSRQDRAVM